MHRKPNIVIFNPDQWRGDVMGHLGNPAAVTPNIDGLVASDTVSFSNAFCQSTVCTPSRCSFMTGWYPHVRGHRTMHHMLHPDRGEPNLLRLLKDAGYFVWWGGKNDLVPGQDGYERYCDVRFRASAEDYARWGVKPHDGEGEESWRGEAGGADYYGFYRGRIDKGRREGCIDGDWAAVLGARDFISEYDGESPFCIFLPLSNPHPPYGVEEPWLRAYPNNRIWCVRSAAVPYARRDDESVPGAPARARRGGRRGGITPQTAWRRPNPSGRRRLRRSSVSLVVDVCIHTLSSSLLDLLASACRRSRARLLG